MNKKMIILIILLIIIIILLIAYFKIGDYFYDISINPQIDKQFVLGALEQSTEDIDNKNEQIKWLEENSENVYIQSTNNGQLKLHSYKIENNQKSNIWAIVIHGYMSQGTGMIGYAQKFYERGYNVLLVDLRGHGLSEGTYVGMGWHDRLDTIDWINYLIERDNDSKIILFGVSMGAATTMMTTGEELPNNVKIAIADCGYTSAWDEFSYQLKRIFNLPNFPVLYAANSSTKRKANYSLKEASSVEQVKKSNTPTLFIHGAADTFVPYKMLDEIYEVAVCKKEKLVVNGAEHGLSSIIEPELYWKTIDNFICTNIDNN